MNVADAEAQAQEILSEISKYWKPQDGPNTIRILDYTSAALGRPLLGKFVKTHPLDKLGNLICAGADTCPVCAIPGVERWSAYYVNLIDRRQPGQVKIGRLSPGTGNNLITLVRTGFDIGNAQTGRDIILMRNVKGKNIRYQVIHQDASPLAPTPELISKLLSQVVDLDIEFTPKMDELQAAANALQSGAPIAAQSLSQRAPVMATAATQPGAPAPQTQVAPTGQLVDHNVTDKCLGQFEPTNQKCGTCTREMECWKMKASQKPAAPEKLANGA